MGQISFDTPQVDHISGMSPTLSHRRMANGMWQVAQRHRWIVATSVALGLLAGGGLLLIMPSTYTAKAILQIDVAKEPTKQASIFHNAPSQAESPLETSTVVQSEAALIKSPLIIQRAIESLKLNDRLDDTPGLLARTLEATEATLGLSHASDNELSRNERLVAGIARSISVEADSRSYLLNILVSTTQADRSVAIASAVAHEYITLRASLNAETAEKTVQWLREVIKGTTLKMEAAEKDVANYRAIHNIIGEGTAQDDSAHQQIIDLQQQLSAATLDRVDKADRLASLQDFAKHGAESLVSDLQSLPAIGMLLQQKMIAQIKLAEAKFNFQPGNPQVLRAQAAADGADALLNDEVRRSIAVLQVGVTIAAHRENDIKSRLDTVREQASRRAETDAGFGRLVAEERSVHDQLLLLYRDQLEATAVRDLQSAPAALLMPARLVPGSPIVQTIIVMVAGFAVGLGLGILYAFLLENIQRGFLSSAELQDAADIRCLGAILDLPQDGTSSARHVALRDEAVRAVGAEVGLFCAHAECRVVLVTSALQDEGSADLCKALAKILVAAGKRVLLIGGETRAGNFEDFAQDTGGHLSNLSQCAYADVDVFRSRRLLDLLSSARTDFDVVLVDSPPVKLAADALVLGRLADAIIHVVRWGHTDRHAVLGAVQRLRNNAIAIDGFVFMGVNPRRQNRLGLADDCFYPGSELPPHRRLAHQSADTLRI